MEGFVEITSQFCITNIIRILGLFMIILSDTLIQKFMMSHIRRCPLVLVAAMQGLLLNCFQIKSCSAPSPSSSTVTLSLFLHMVFVSFFHNTRISIMKSLLIIQVLRILGHLPTYSQISACPCTVIYKIISLLKQRCKQWTFQLCFTVEEKQDYLDELEWVKQYLLWY